MEESNRLDPSTRAVINTNFDTNNIVPMDESLPRIKTTLQKCQKILKNHCGPQSGYAMLVNNMSAGVNFEPNVFTRDGIRICRTSSHRERSAQGCRSFPLEQAPCLSL